MPGLALMRVVQLTAAQFKFSIYNEASVEPKEERTLLITFGNLPTVCKEHDPSVATDHWCVQQLYVHQPMDLLNHHLAVLLSAKVGLVGNGVASALQSEEKLGAIARTDRVHASQCDPGDYHGLLWRHHPTRPHHLFIVANIATLAWSFHTLELGGNIFICASISKEAQAVLGIFEFPEVNEEDTNHGASAAFASLAVHGNHILLILVHPVSHTAAELQHVYHGRHIVVINHVALHSAVEERHVIVALGAQVVQAVVARMLRVHEACHILDVIPVHGHPAGRGKRHGNDSWCDIGEVKVKTILLVASLVLRHKLPGTALEVLPLPKDPGDSYQADQTQRNKESHRIG